MIKSELLNIITFLVKFTSSTGQKKHLLSILCWKTKPWVYKVKVLKGKQLIGSFLLSTIIILLKVTRRIGHEKYLLSVLCWKLFLGLVKSKI